MDVCRQYVMSRPATVCFAHSDSPCADDNDILRSLDFVAILLHATNTIFSLLRQI